MLNEQTFLFVHHCILFSICVTFCSSKHFLQICKYCLIHINCYDMALELFKVKKYTLEDYTITILYVLLLEFFASCVTYYQKINWYEFLFWCQSWKSKSVKSVFSMLIETSGSEKNEIPNDGENLGKCLTFIQWLINLLKNCFFFSQFYCLGKRFQH